MKSLRATMMDAIIEHVTAADGKLSVAAKTLKVHSHTLKQYLRMHPELFHLRSGVKREGRGRATDPTLPATPPKTTIIKIPHEYDERGNIILPRGINGELAP